MKGLSRVLKNPNVIVGFLSVRLKPVQLLK